MKVDVPFRIGLLFDSRISLFCVARDQLAAVDQSLERVAAAVDMQRSSDKPFGE